MNRNATPKKKGESNSSIWVVILLALVLTAIMLLAVAGGSMFDSITENRAGNMDRRAALSYVSARVLSSDEKNRISVEEDDSGWVLHIGDRALFLRDGFLCEGTGRDDEDARQVAKTARFDVAINGRLLTVTTDEGSRELYLHSEEAAI